MRYIAYGLAILAALLTVTFATGYLPRDATASHSEANDNRELGLSAGHLGDDAMTTLDYVALGVLVALGLSAIAAVRSKP